MKSLLSLLLLSALSQHDGLLSSDAAAVFPAHATGHPSQKSLQSPCSNNPQLSSYPFCDPSLSLAERAADLIKRLTVEEKIGMLGNTSPMAPRLGIQSYQWWSEALHGVALSPGVQFVNGKEGGISNATSFPAPILTAASFNRSLWYEMGRVISDEARAMSNNGQSGLNFFSPNINLWRDPRWGRGVETPGEDPYLTSQYAIQYVKAMQGEKTEYALHSDRDATTADDEHEEKYLKTIACCKHYTAYDVEDGRIAFNAVVNKRDLWESFQQPFDACVKDAGAYSVMCSYNSVNGVPACASRFLLQDELRGRMQFDGFVVSDCDAVWNIYDPHAYTKTPEETVAVALQAGTDLDCGDAYPKYTNASLYQGLITMNEIDAALNHTLLALLRLGLFDDYSAQAYRKLDASHVNTAYAQQLALEAAEQGIVLIENEKHILPLDKSKAKRITVTGPHSNATGVMQSSYYGVAPYLITPCLAFQHVSSQSHCVTGIDSLSPIPWERISKLAAETCSLDDKSKQPDAIVFVGGLDMSIEAEGHDRDSVLLPAVQLNLAKAIKKACPKIPHILVLYGGAVDYPVNIWDAVLWAGYPGQSGGTAIANVIYGDANPSGRMPITWYPESYVQRTDVTIMDMRSVEGSKEGRTYRFYTPSNDANVAADQPRALFGHGFSYTQFQYKADQPQLVVKSDNTVIDPSQMYYPASSAAALMDTNETPSFKISDLKAGHSVKVTVQVSNVGQRDGADTVHLYIYPNANRDKNFAIHDPPYLQLRKFERLPLSLGQSRSVDFYLTADDFKLYNEEGHADLYAGSYGIEVNGLNGVSTLSVIQLEDNKVNQVIQ